MCGGVGAVGAGRPKLHVDVHLISGHGVTELHVKPKVNEDRRSNQGRQGGQKREQRGPSRS